MPDGKAPWFDQDTAFDCTARYTVMFRANGRGTKTHFMPSHAASPAQAEAEVRKVFQFAIVIGVFERVLPW